jgi:hypothetical protein
MNAISAVDGGEGSIDCVPLEPLKDEPMPKFLNWPCAFVVASLAAGQVHAAGDRLTVHEWGTFTSIAGTGGVGVDWLPLSGPNDLPCFVNQMQDDGSSKSSLIGTVRMETPVLYFYAPHELMISAEVRFPHGLITEWYPRAELAPTSNGEGAERSSELRHGAISWRNVSVAPQATLKLADDGKASHYYAARAVDAAPLLVGQQQEKFLFYRGVGRFSLPVSARAREDGGVVIENLVDEAVGGMIFFEKRGSKISYRSVGRLQARARVTVETPSLDADPAGLRDEIEQLLIDQGLFPREAKAMLATWHDAWFEEGARLLYLVPRRTIDAELPLAITPRPDDVARVFMGRLEVITPATLKAVERAIADSDPATLELYGRFVMPVVQRISDERGHMVDGTKLSRLLGAASSGTAAGCR